MLPPKLTLRRQHCLAEPSDLKVSIETGHVEVELQRVYLGLGFFLQRQCRCGVSTDGCFVCCQIERPLQSPLVEHHRQAQSQHWIGMVDQPKVQMGTRRIT